MKNVLKAVSYVDGKHSTILHSALIFFFSRSCISLQFQSAGSEKSDAITEATDASESDRWKTWQAMRWRVN